jgi:hypothetical protein
LLYWDYSSFSFRGKLFSIEDDEMICVVSLMNLET